MILHFSLSLLCKTQVLIRGYTRIYSDVKNHPHTAHQKTFVSEWRENQRFKDGELFPTFHLPSGLCNSKGRQPTHAHWPLSGLLERQQAFRILQYCIQHICFTLNVGPFMSKALTQSWILGLLRFLKLLRQSAFLRLAPMLPGITDTWPHPRHALCAPNAQHQRKCLSIVNTQAILMCRFTLLQLYF